MIRLFAAVVLLLVVPVVLKERTGDLRQVAYQSWYHGVASAHVLAPMRSIGLPVSTEQEGSYGTADAAACKLVLNAADPQGQSLGYLMQLSTDFDRLSFLYRGRIYSAFPYLRAITRHILFIVANTAGIDTDYQPVVALFEQGPCSELDRLRQ
ncbi:hypothetical protein ACFFP0_21145 [Rhizobium puerariae]|uniref:Uncharacterized protein n=1 Tax=Rhizobium puerariae TaxID=1585791 RepID=A0ABV6AL81_9HYPH